MRTFSIGYEIGLLKCVQVCILCMLRLHCWNKYLMERNLEV